MNKKNISDLCEKNEEHFGKITSHLYSFAIDLGILKLHNFVSNDIIENINSNTKSILDIGCGNGLILKKIASNKKVNNISLYGIDPSEEMIKISKNKLKKMNKKVNLKLGSSRKINFKIKFDIIYTSLSYHHWNNREKSIKYILNKLNKKGSFIIYEYNKSKKSFFNLGHNHMMNKKEFKNIMFKGFKRNITQDQDIIKVEFKKNK